MAGNKNKVTAGTSPAAPATLEGLTLHIQGGVATIAIDRPQARNALNLATMRSLGLALDEAESKRARVLVIRGAGDKAFCAGGDLKELEHMRSAEQAAQMARTMRTTLDRLSILRMPVIAALHGVPSDRFDARVHELAAGIAAAPPAAVAGIKRSVDSVRPQRNPELADKAITEFARTWAAPAHWRAVEKMDKRRRSDKAGP